MPLHHSLPATSTLLPAPHLLNRTRTALVVPPMYRPPQYKDRVNMELIKPAVDWRKSGVTVATGSAAVAKEQ